RFSRDWSSDVCSSDLDGFGFDGIGFNDEVEFTAHGSTVDVSKAFIGFPINTIIEPMPLAISMSGSPRNTTLTRPKHVRTINFIRSEERRVGKECSTGL